MRWSKDQSLCGPTHDTTAPHDVTFSAKAEACYASNYLFFRRFAVFAFFAFRFFAICCPPSHDMWRCRNSAVANRRALHPDYTSGMKKTLTPLNGGCTRAPKSPDGRCDRERAARATPASDRVTTRPLAKKRDTRKPL
jgi:hypothetical protein